MNRRDMEILNKMMDSTINDTQAAEIGKIQGPPVNGFYTVVTSSGFTLECQNATRNKWDDGAWVTVESVSGSSRITGIGSSRGG